LVGNAIPSSASDDASKNETSRIRNRRGRHRGARARARRHAGRPRRRVAGLDPHPRIG